MNIQTPETRLRFREALGMEIDRLISLLDEIDEDPDLEETGDEHDTSVAEGWRHSGQWKAGQQDMILEDDEEGDVGEDDGADEPNLGSPELRDRTSQERWAQGCRNEREEDAGEDREEENEHGGNVTDEPHDQHDEGNDEPTLGWANPMCGTFATPEGWVAIDTWDGPLGFTGEGHVTAHDELRRLYSERKVPYSAVCDSRPSAALLGLPDPGSMFLKITQP